MKLAGRGHPSGEVLALSIADGGILRTAPSQSCSCGRAVGNPTASPLYVATDTDAHRLASGHPGVGAISDGQYSETPAWFLRSTRTCYRMQPAPALGPLYLEYHSDPRASVEQVQSVGKRHSDRSQSCSYGREHESHRASCFASTTDRNGHLPYARCPLLPGGAGFHLHQYGRLPRSLSVSPHNKRIGYRRSVLWPARAVAGDIASLGLYQQPAIPPGQQPYFLSSGGGSSLHTSPVHRVRVVVSWLGRGGLRRSARAIGHSPWYGIPGYAALRLSSLCGSCATLDTRPLVVRRLLDRGSELHCTLACGPSTPRVSRPSVLSCMPPIYWRGTHTIPSHMPHYIRGLPNVNR